MQLVIRYGKVQAIYADEVDILKHYNLSDYEIVNWDGPEQFLPDPETEELPDDPRTPARKTNDRKKRHLKRRLKGYPSQRACLEMIFRDMRDGTTEYVDTITAINNQFQPPE